MLNTYRVDDDIQKIGMSAQHISAHLGDYESARTGFFTFLVPLANLVKVTTPKLKAVEDYTDEEKYGPSDASDYLTLNVTKAAVPHFSVEALEYRRGNEVVKFAGVPTFNAGEITVADVVGLDTKSILMAWQGLVYDVKTRKGGRMKEYKRDCTLVEYTQDYEKIRSWTLYGCWISELSEDPFDKESDGKRSITATIQYDRAEMELPEEEAE